MKSHSFKNSAKLLNFYFIFFSFLTLPWFYSGCTKKSDQGKIVRIAIPSEPPNLNTTLMTDTWSGFVANHIQEGLMRTGTSGGNPEAGVAERWEINDKGATFYLRKNALWSDGQPVTAKDFVFSWRKAIDPKTASQYAFILFAIKNAQAINAKKKPVTELGAKAVDDYTLKVDFEKPCGYFLGLAAFPTYLPIREDFYNKFGEKYGADADKILYNGPFILEKWVHGASLTLRKNPNYWNKDQIQIEGIDIPYITPDPMATFNFYKDGKIDLVGFNRETLKNAEKEKFPLKKYSDGALVYLQFNFRKGRLTANKNLRKALAAVYDSGEHVNKVIGIPGTVPALSIIPSWIKGVNGKFREEFPITRPPVDLDAAKKYLAAAIKELGLKGPPSLTLLSDDGAEAAKSAEYIQELFKRTLGVTIKIDKQIFKQRLAKQSAGAFDITASLWGPDYSDPMTYADLFTTWNDNNNGKWENPDYDKLIMEAQSTTDQNKRMQAMHAAEKILLDEVAIVPQYERIRVYTHNSKISGVIRNAVGPDPDLTRVRFTN